MGSTLAAEQGETSCALPSGPLAESPFPDAVAGEELVGCGESPSLAVSPSRHLHLSEPKTDLRRPGNGVVIGVYSERGRVGRYTWVISPEESFFSAPGEAKPGQGTPAIPRPRVSEGLAKRLATTQPSEFVPVVIILEESLSAPLTSFSAAHFARIGQTVGSVSRETLLEARAHEASAKQAAVVAWLLSRAITDVSAYWLINALSAKVPAAMIGELAAQPAIKSIEFDSPLDPTTAGEWDGENVNVTTGLNAGMYTSAGYTGGRYSDGQNLALGVLDRYFADDHRVFFDWCFTFPALCFPRWRGRWDCHNNPCTAGLPAPGVTDDVHGSYCASAAAADAMAGQISGTAAERRDRTGVAPDAHLDFISTGDISSTIRGLQRAVTDGVDVVSESMGGRDGACDGFHSGWETAVYNAHQAGTLVVGSAGNEDDAGVCNLTSLAEVPSILTVGATVDPGAGSYAAADVYARSARGGVNVTIGGSQYNEVFTAVDVLAPVRWSYSAGKNQSYHSVVGTSLAAPQVAGAALLFKDWLMGMGFGYAADYPGVLFTSLLAMTDRANTATTYRTARFDPKWGGGRIQMRYYALPDHPSGLFAWDLAWYVLSNGQHIQHPVVGTGAEPNGINVFKSYAVFFEQDGSDVADVDMYLYDHDCGTGKNLLGSDTSRDYKSMVSLGANAAGKAICVDLYGYHIPPGQTRDVVLLTYYTDETSMR